MPIRQPATTFNPLNQGRPRIIGRLYKGHPKTDYGAGKDLLRNLRFESPNPAIQRIFTEAYGSNVTEQIRVYLPFDTATEVFDSWMVVYGKGTGLQRQCDRENIVFRKEIVQYGKDRNDNALYTNRINTDPIPCPYKDHPKCPECAPSRKLFVFIEEIYQAGYRGVVQLESKALNDGRLEDDLLYKEKRLQACGGTISQLPVPSPETDGYIRWILSRVEEPTHKPLTAGKSEKYRQTGQYTASTDWLLSLEIDPGWEQMVKPRWGYSSLEWAAKERGVALPSSGNGLYLPGANSSLEPAPYPSLASPGLPEYSAVEILDENALWDVFKVKSSDPTNFERLMKVGEQIGATRDAIATAITLEYPGKHTSELQDWHCKRVIDRLLMLWAIAQATTSGEPIYLNQEEAEADYYEVVDWETPDVLKVTRWLEYVGQRKAGGSHA